MKNYITYMRRQAKHVQHLHAFIFAGSITFVIAAIILYSDYGFWHERYNRNDTSAITSTTEMAESPIKVLSRFFGEAHSQFKGVASSSGGFFEGRETYIKPTENLDQNQ